MKKTEYNGPVPKKQIQSIARTYLKVKKSKTYKKFKKSYGAVIILSLMFVSVGMSGFYFGSIGHDTKPVQSYQTTESKPLVAEAVQVDTVETDLTSNSDWAMNFSQDNQGIQFKWSGQGINQNVSVTGFECNIDNNFWFPCGTEYSPTHQPVGEHTFEVRAIGNDSNVDHSPATWIWNVK